MRLDSHQIYNTVKWSQDTVKVVISVIDRWSGSLISWTRVTVSQEHPLGSNRGRGGYLPVAEGSAHLSALLGLQSSRGHWGECMPRERCCASYFCTSDFQVLPAPCRKCDQALCYTQICIWNVGVNINQGYIEW